MERALRRIFDSTAVRWLFQHYRPHFIHTTMRATVIWALHAESNGEIVRLPPRGMNSLQQQSPWGLREPIRVANRNANKTNTS